jgi:elongation factor 2
MQGIRNLCVIAHPDHGKSSFCDALLAMAGLVSEEDAGQKRVTDTREDEKERGITIKSTAVGLNLLFEGKNYYVNLVDSPGHVDFSAEVTAAIRLTDAAFLLVDVVEGVSTQTETVLRQALAEQVVPVLVLNKMDRLFFELKCEAEDAYKRIETIVKQVNAYIHLYSASDAKRLELNPAKGNVIFGSALHGWGFTIPLWVEFLTSSQDGKEDTVQVQVKKVEKGSKKLWGHHYTNDVPPKRLFCHFIYNALKDLFDACLSKEADSKISEELEKKLRKIKVFPISNAETLTGKELYKNVMRQWMPLSRTLMKGLIYHMPDPIQAQKTRVDVLYTGPQQDSVYQGISRCDPLGPLVIFISKMLPSTGGKSFAFGRIFSGTVQPNTQVFVLDSTYDSTKGEAKMKTARINRVCKVVGVKIVSVDSASAGDLVALSGLEEVMTKCGTLTNAEERPLYPIRSMKFAVHPVVQVSVKVKDSVHARKLTEGIRKLIQLDPCIESSISEAGENILAGVGELHLEVCIHDLKQMLHGIDLMISEPIVPFRETIRNKSDRICLAKSPNGLNRLFMEAQPLDEKVMATLETKDSTTKDLIRVLMDQHKWSKEEAKKIWGIYQGCVLVDMTKSMQHLQDIRQNVVDAFEEFCDSGILCGEKVRGVRFNLLDAKLHPDSIHRQVGQIAPMTRRCLSACFLTAKPTLVEPFYKIDIQVDETKENAVYNFLAQRRAQITQSQSDSMGTKINSISAVIPVLESMKLDSTLKSLTSGRAFTQLSFSHWEVMTDNEKTIEMCIKKTRLRKQWKEELPMISSFLDKL